MAKDEQIAACEALAMCALAHLEDASEAAASTPRRGRRFYWALAAKFETTGAALAAFAQTLRILAGEKDG